jgi:hypothetical protein
LFSFLKWFWSERIMSRVRWYPEQHRFIRFHSCWILSLTVDVRPWVFSMPSDFLNPWITWHFLSLMLDGPGFWKTFFDEHFPDKPRTLNDQWDPWKHLW